MTLQLISQVLPPVPDGPMSPDAARVLGGARLGELPGTADWPVQNIVAPLLGSTAAVIEETWLAGEPVRAGHSEGIAWRRAGDLLYGVVELDETRFADAGTASPLQAASAEAYRRIFRLLEAQRLPHLWRLWNYLAGINDESHGLERYRQFNIGRQDAFLEFDRGATGNVPAACALGLRGGPLSIAFLAGGTAAVPIENPRQVSAYHYPDDYGPRSPTFSRAALVYPPGQETLFVSGTASIVGHRTTYPGDVAGQCREIIANIAAVLAEANRACRGAAYTPGELSYRVYVRHASDFAAIRETLQGLIGAGAEVVYVLADICRADLLLEIEAMASHALRET